MQTELLNELPARSESWPSLKSETLGNDRHGRSCRENASLPSSYLSAAKLHKSMPGVTVGHTGPPVFMRVMRVMNLEQTVVRAGI